jgi:phospholipid transport system transporter-binding protein
MHPIACKTVRREGDKISVEGSITIDNVVAMTQQGVTLLEGNSLVVDLTGVAKVDSSVVSMLLEWLREANRRNVRLHFVNIPESVKSLMQLYGVSEFFFMASNDQPVS